MAYFCGSFDDDCGRKFPGTRPWHCFNGGCMRCTYVYLNVLGLNLDFTFFPLSVFSVLNFCDICFLRRSREKIPPLRHAAFACSRPESECTRPTEPITVTTNGYTLIRLNVWTDAHRRDHHVWLHTRSTRHV